MPAYTHLVRTLVIALAVGFVLVGGGGSVIIAEEGIKLPLACSILAHQAGGTYVLEHLVGDARGVEL